MSKPINLNGYSHREKAAEREIDAYLASVATHPANILNDLRHASTE
jgi:hypothetical protein